MWSQYVLTLINVGSQRKNRKKEINTQNGFVAAKEELVGR